MRACDACMYVCQHVCMYDIYIYICMCVCVCVCVCVSQCLKACESAPGRSISFFGGSTVKTERPPIVFYPVVARIDQIHCVCCLYFCCMRHFNESCACRAVGLRGLLEVDLCWELWCFLKPHMFTCNA